MHAWWKVFQINKWFELFCHACTIDFSFKILHPNTVETDWPVAITDELLATHFGTARPNKIGKPNTKRFLEELRSTYWRLEIPTAAMTPIGNIKENNVIFAHCVHFVTESSCTTMTTNSLFILPNITMKTPPTIGEGMVTNRAPNLLNKPKTIIMQPAVWITLLLPTLSNKNSFSWYYSRMVWTHGTSDKTTYLCNANSADIFAVRCCPRSWAPHTRQYATDALNHNAYKTINLHCICFLISDCCV